MSAELDDPLGTTARQRVFRYVTGVPAIMFVTVVVVAVLTAPMLQFQAQQQAARGAFGTVAILGIGVWFGTEWASGGFGGESDTESEEQGMGLIIGLIALALFFNFLVSLAILAGLVVVEVASPAVALIVAMLWPLWEVKCASREPLAIPASVLGVLRFISQMADRRAGGGGRVLAFLGRWSTIHERAFAQAYRRVS